MSKIYTYEHKVLDTEVEPEGNANCLAYFPADKNQYETGDSISIYRL